MFRLQTLRDQRTAIATIAARYGAGNVRVFGSVARGDDGPTSDIDLLVEFQPGHGLLAHAALIRELEGLLGCKVDVVRQNGLKSRLRSRVLEEAIAL